MGARLGRYAVLKHLASGGMADVLLGCAEGVEGFERHVVVKRIKPEHAGDQRFIRMFLDEARVAATLHHQHVVQVHDVGESDGEYFIAMEYIHGEDVRTLLASASRAREHVPLGHALAIVSAAAAGLHYAHERRGPDKRSLGIVHRDISPSNILVGYDGSIKVVDFGIAKASARQETRSGTLKGKVAYMSPEQCMSGEVDRRSDVYSLGVVLYELTTTTKLFRGENDYLVMDQIVNGRVTMPRVRRPDLPAELSALIMRAIATDPERRFASADELRLAIDQFAARANLTTSTSAIAGYMRKQFGDKPEPWIDLTEPGAAALEISVAEPPAPPPPAPVEAGGWRPVWVNHHSAEVKITGSGATPRAVTPVSGMQRAVTPVSGGSVRRTITERSSSNTAPTDSKMGWESQLQVRASRFSWGKLAIVSAPAIVVLAAGLWWLANADGSDTAAEAAPPPSAAPATPVVPPHAPVAPQQSPHAPPHASAEAAGALTPPPVSPASFGTARAAPVAPPAEADAGKAAPADERADRETAPAREAARDASRESARTTSRDTARASDDDGDAGRRPRKTSGSKLIESLTPPSGAEAARAAAASPPESTLLAQLPASGSSAAPTAPTAPASPAPAAPSASPSSRTAPMSYTSPYGPTTPPLGVSPSPVPRASALASVPGLAPGMAAPPKPASDTPALVAQTVVDRLAADHTRELSKCDGGEQLHGEITVRFTVDAAGKVTKAQVSTSLSKAPRVTDPRGAAVRPEPKVAACVLRSVQKWQFPPQSSSGAQGTYTLSFQ